MKLKKKKAIKDYCLLGIIIIYILWSLLSIDSISKYGILINTTFLLICFSICMLFFGLRIERNAVLRKRVRLNLLLYFLFYYIIIYGMGLFFGYQVNVWKFDNLLNMVLYILGGIFLELVRYIVIYRNINKKPLFCIYTILFSIIMSLHFVQIFGSFNNYIFIFITIYNFLLSYISYHLGYSMTFLYRGCFELFILSVPVISNINYKFLIIVMVLFVGATGNWIRSEVKIFDKIVEDRKVVIKRLFLNFIITFNMFIITLILVTGITNFSLIAIGSSSMSPNIEKGDMVLVRKDNLKEEYFKNDIVVFEYKDKKIIHRIISKKKVNGNIIYEVKGDNNREKDKIILKNDDVLGKIIYRIPYVAYPIVKLKEIIKG